MDETQVLIEKIIRATEQRKIKWEYDSSDSTTIAKTVIGQGKIKLEWSCPGVKDLRQMEIVLECPGYDSSRIYLCNREEEVKELLDAICFSFSGDAYPVILEELEKLNEGEEV